MSPSPPFSSPLSLSYTSSARPGIIGEHRGPNIQQPHPQHASESANGEYLLHLLQAGGQLLPFQQRHSNATGNGGGEGFERQQRTSHYGFGVPGIPGIAPSGDHRSMPTWDPAVAALGPSHSHNQSGMAGCGGLAGDERNYLPGFYSSSQFNHMSPIPSGWPTPPPFPSLPPPPPPPRQQQQHNRPRNPFAPTPSLGESSSSSNPSPVGFRLLQGRPGGHMFVPVPGALPSVLYGSHVDMPFRRPVEWHPTLQQPQHQHQQLEGATAERSIPPTLPVTVHAPGSVPAEGVPHQQFFGNGAELMKLLQISSSKDASGVAIDPIAVDRQTGTGGINSNAAPKMNSPVVHGPIGPPKRNESSGASTISYPADDILGRFWPAPTPSTSNGGKGHNTNSTVLTDEESSMNLGAQDRCRRGEPSPGDGMADIGVGGKSISYPSTFGDRDGRAPRTTPSSRFFNSKGRGGGAGEGGGEVTPENVEFPGRKELLGGWGVEFLEDVGMASGNQDYHKIRGGAGAGREELFVKAVEQQTGKLVFHQEPLLRPLGPSSKDSVESQFLRDSSCRVDVGARGGLVGARRIPHAGSRAEIGSRRTGRASGGQWVVVKERQSEREGLETGGLNSDGGAENGSEKGSNSTGNSCKEEMMAFPKEGGVFHKAKDDTRRRRGQQQEWRMKTPNHTQMQGQTSCTFLKFSEFPADLESQEQIDGGVSSPRKIRPLAAQVDYPGLPANVLRDSLLQPGSATEEAKRSFHELASEHNENEEGERKEGEDEKGESLVGCMEMVMDEQEVGLRQIGFAPAQEGVECQIQLEQLLEFRRHPQRPMSISSLKPETKYRPDLDKFTDQVLALYLSLIPTEEEDVRRREFLSHLDQLVSREWQGAMLFLFGSCANAFGVCNSDIDVCLSVNDFQLTKADLVLKMAAILRAENMQNVQALTHARVPIVKFTDPSTGISGDICVNNMLAVVNSKLLHDYSQIDVRLRQLAFLVKHWAKRRQVNETYRGTLSSYAYVLMCIHFLQQRKPPILPCLQEMPSTYSVTLGSIDCAYFDQVETLRNFGFGNKESLGELLTSFFEYWAFGHDYNRAVISVRTGGYLSKDEKEWTRRIGNERHLICIEDPLETVHDLGRVVDRHSIRVLRDEFCRAAKILRHDLDPCTSLFDPYVRERP